MSSALNMGREGKGKEEEGEGDRQATRVDADSQSVCVSDGGLTEIISGAAALKVGLFPWIQLSNSLPDRHLLLLLAHFFFIFLHSHFRFILRLNTILHHIALFSIHFLSPRSVLPHYAFLPRLLVFCPYPVFFR